MVTMDAFCEKHRITAECQYGAVPVPEKWRDAHPWKVTLKRGKRRLTVPFFQGPAHTTEPTAADVLACLVSDAWSADQASSFEEWARDLGYDTDSREAERTFKACEALIPRLQRFLGDLYDAAAQAEH